jgi:hypothetical protein
MGTFYPARMDGWLLFIRAAAAGMEGWKGRREVVAFSPPARSLSFNVKRTFCRMRLPGPKEVELHLQTSVLNTC